MVPLFAFTDRFLDPFFKHKLVARCYLQMWPS